MGTKSRRGSGPNELAMRHQGWIGTEVVAIAGNDPDPNCLFHQLVGDAIQYRYRFHAILPVPIPGEPPGINLSNLPGIPDPAWHLHGLSLKTHRQIVSVRGGLRCRVLWP